MPIAAPASSHAVLVVDDDPEIRALLHQYLQACGLRPLLAAGGAEMRQYLEEHGIDLVVLDVMFSQEDGLDLLRWLRKHTRVPVIMVTALSSPIDRVVGLGVGADDHVCKPFEPRELVARIHAVLRRAPARSAEAATDSILPVKLRFGAWRLDTRSRELRHDDGVLAPLSTSEYRLLCVFLKHPRMVLSRERLVELAHKRDLEPSDRTIDIQVYRLRRRLRDTRRVVRGHAPSLRRALVNLLRNAVVPASEPELSVEAEGTRVQVHVMDRGPGIPESEMARVMQPFEQLDRSRGSTSGAGLGLSIANEIAMRHGGPLLISNRAGGGLCATLVLTAA